MNNEFSQTNIYFNLKKIKFLNSFYNNKKKQNSYAFLLIKLLNHKKNVHSIKDIVLLNQNKIILTTYDFLKSFNENDKKKHFIYTRI